MQNVCVVLLV